MNLNYPVRLGPAELTLVEQLQAAGATAEAERFATVGLPTRRVEAYHYTDLKTLLRAIPPMAEPGTEAGSPGLDLVGATVFHIVNGVAEVPAALPAGLHAHLVEGSPLTLREDDILPRLNSGLTRKTLSLEISGNAGVVHIDRRVVGAAGHAASGLSVFVADGAEVTILETVSGSDDAHVTNHGSFLTLGNGARVTHVAVDMCGGKASTFSTSEYRIGENAKLRTVTLNAGSILSRAQLMATFAGRGAHADFTGLNLVGPGQHCDITLEVTHAVADTSCKPLYKQVARGRSTAVFQGKLVVARDAQKTDAKLMTQGLMLSEEAEILTKPELEIYADDVVCGHGSTCGALDPTALFYLMSRGIPRAEAEMMLIRSFVAEVVDPIEDEGLSAALTGVIERWLNEGTTFSGVNRRQERRA